MTNILKIPSKTKYFFQKRGLQAPAAFLPTTHAKNRSQINHFGPKMTNTLKIPSIMKCVSQKRGLHAPAFLPTTHAKYRTRITHIGLKMTNTVNIPSKKNQDCSKTRSSSACGVSPRIRQFGPTMTNTFKIPSQIICFFQKRKDLAAGA